MRYINFKSFEEYLRELEREGTDRQAEVKYKVKEKHEKITKHFSNITSYSKNENVSENLSDYN